MFLRSFVFPFLFMLSSLNVNAQASRDIIYSACSKNNEVWLSDIKILVESLRTENKKIRARNLSEAESSKLSKQFGVDVANLYDDIVFKRKKHAKEDSSFDEKNYKIYSLIIGYKSAAVFHTAGEILSKNHELNETRAERIFVEKCESIVDN